MDLKSNPDFWHRRACGLLAALQVASPEKLASAMGLSVDDVRAAAETFDPAQHAVPDLRPEYWSVERALDRD